MENSNNSNINIFFTGILNEIVKDSQKFRDDIPEFNILSRIDEITRSLSSGNGVVGRLTHTADIVAFFQKHKTELNEFLYEELERSGNSLSDMFGDSWDKEDPLALNPNNQSLIVWLAYEDIANQLYKFILYE